MDDRTLMQRLLDDGYPAEEIYHHGSDLYVYITNKTAAVIRRWMKDNGFRLDSPLLSTFTDNITGRRMYDVAFQYTPYWEEVAKRDAIMQNEVELNDQQIERLDEIDHAMYDFLLVLLEKTPESFLWDMHHIGEAVDAVQDVMLSHGFDIHRPYVEDDGEHRTVHDYERASDR